MHNELIDSIHPLIKTHGERPVFIVIDGPAGAGKTTLADELISSIGAGEVIHCDDLYNGWNDALSPTLEEHFQEWIVGPLKNGLMPKYRKFDWSTGKYGLEVQVPQTPLLILEGVGSALKTVTDMADISIWMEIPESLGATFGLERVLERHGRHLEAQMRQWIVEQQQFFQKHHNQENCSIQLPYGAPAE